jgi:hypothetical protein
VGSSRPRRPSAPPDAERARSVAARGGTAALVGTGFAAGPPLVHHVAADGSAALLFDDDEPLLGQVRRAGGGFTAMVELADRAPVDLREPVRGLLWITGRLWLPPADAARRLALQAADADPHPDLLRLGHGATLVRLDPDFAVLSDAEGSAVLAPVELAAVRPDPFSRTEGPLLAHLEADHPDTLATLAHYLPAALRDRPDIRVRPLGLDRCGLRLRVEAPARDHDLRLPWHTAPATVPELWAELRRLIAHAARPAPGRAVPRG